MSEIRCEVCFRHCILNEGRTGFCRARMNQNGQNVCTGYGRITSLALDPIEKKPLSRFFPGSMILSAGSYGCNLACPFCQNWQISMADETSVHYETVSAEELSAVVLRTEGNLGIAFTYNEPLISWEYIRDVAKLVKPYGKKVVVVSNGCASPSVLMELEPYVDAMNIDLKGDGACYREFGGSYEQAKETIERMHAHCHVEVTSLIIPGKNDSEEWVEKEAKWLASLDPSIVLHLTRYFPNWKYDLPATPKETIWKLQKTASQFLETVLTGNMI